MISNLVEMTPTLVEAGRLYIAQPPLYRIQSGKKLTFLQSKEELDGFLLNESIESVDFIYDGKKLTSKKLKSTFLDLLNYKNKMDELSKKYNIHPTILELAFIQTYDADEEAFDLPDRIELEVSEDDNLSVTGYYQHTSGNEYFITLVNANVNTFMQDINDITSNYLHLINNLEFDKLRSDNPTLIGKFNDLIDTVYKKNSVIRLKGLGETQPEDLKVTTVDPDTRKLVQVTFDNLEHIKQTLLNFMGGDETIDFRKEFIIKQFANVDKENCFE